MESHRSDRSETRLTQLSCGGSNGSDIGGGDALRMRESMHSSSGGGAARETGGACAQLSMGCKGAQVRYGRARTLSTMMPKRKSPKATLIMPPEPSRVVTGPAARRSRRWSRGEPAAHKSTQRDKHGQKARALSRVLGASMAVPGDVRVHTSVPHPRRKMHRLTRHTFGARSQRWVCSGSHPWAADVACLLHFDAVGRRSHECTAGTSAPARCRHRLMPSSLLGLPRAHL